MPGWKWNNLGTRRGPTFGVWPYSSSSTRECTVATRSCVFAFRRWQGGGLGGAAACGYAHDEALTGTGSTRTRHRSASASRALAIYARNFQLCPETRRRPAVTRRFWCRPSHLTGGRQRLPSWALICAPLEPTRAGEQSVSRRGSRRSSCVRGPSCPAARCACRVSRVLTAQTDRQTDRQTASQPTSQPATTHTHKHAHARRHTHTHTHTHTRTDGRTATLAAAGSARLVR